VRFTITPLGSAGGRTVGQVVDDIVRYLEPRSADPERGPGGVPEGEGPSSYYADRGSEPGRWLGHGALEANLTGRVDPDDFAKVMAGRDPGSGARLITAQGSAGRVPTLGAGTATRLRADGLPLYDIADVAAALKTSQRDAESLMRAGERVAVMTMATMFTGAPIVTEPAASYLVPIVDADGNRWVTQDELDRVADARSRGTPPEEVAAAGAADDQLSVVQAARMSGLSSRYVRSLCRRYDDRGTEIEAAVAEGRPVRRAYLVSHKGTRGQWLVTRRELVAFLERRVAPAVRVGYDLTLTTEKSLGVLALLGDDRTRATVLDAIEAGNDLGLRHLEYRAASARSKGAQVGIRGWTVASFRHLTSRALDPFPHHHNVVANTIVDEHGTRRALDARQLYWQAQEASALATAHMRHQLTQTLGVRWRPGRNGGWEIDVISDDVVREFSQRRGEIDDAVAELEEAIGRTRTLDELQSIIVATRPDKQDVDPRQLVAGWWTRARAHGLTPDRLAGITGQPPPEAHADPDVIYRRLADPETGICAGSSIFTRADAVAALVDLPVPTGDGDTQPLLVPAEEIERLADDFLASDHVVPIEPADIAASSVLARTAIYTTREILEVQHRILDTYRNGQHTHAGAVPSEQLDAILRDDRRLTAEQRELVQAFCQSGHRVQCAIGRAGAGKTTTMRLAASAWTAAGYRMIGTAVKGEAARTLAEGAEIPTETVAWFLARRNNATLPLDDRTVLIVDEASTLSDRDLDVLLTITSERGTVVRLIGDPAQHGAISAGGMFRHLCELHPDDTPELTTTHRLTDPDERAAVEALRDGRVDDALDRLETAGRLHVAGDDLDLYLGMLRSWWHAHVDGDHHPMVDRRHHTRRQLNRLARQLLRTNGELGEVDLSASGDRAFAVGDRVVARMAARHLHVPGQPDAYLRNGATGTITAVCPGRVPAGDRLAVDVDGIGRIEIPRGFFDEHDGPGKRRDVGIDHAYAVTSYAVQGATYTTSTSRIDERASRSEAYVDITRGRHANHLFLTRTSDPLDGESLPKVPPPPIVDAVERRLSESGPEVAAIEVDPRAPERDNQTPTTGQRAEAGAPLAERIPRPGTVPFLTRRWDETLTTICNYHNRWRPTPGTGRYDWALGSPVDTPAATEQRAAVENAIARLAVAVAIEQAGERDRPNWPQWASALIAERVAAGAPHTDVEQFDDLIDRIETYRQRAGLTDPDGEAEPPALPDALGPEPDDPALRAEHQLLCHQIQQATTRPASTLALS
jgi:conjugative relaxase-like TrwC/TraI family protein